MDTVLKTVQVHTNIKLGLAFDDSPTSENVINDVMYIYGLTNRSDQQWKYDTFILDKLRFLEKQLASFTLFYKLALLTLPRIS